MKKRLFAVMLALVAALGVMSASAVGTFADVTDAETARNVELLYALGVVNGDGSGNFNPGGTLSRAEFTKMAVMLVGEGDDVASYRTTTIFPDLRASHWASGYVNLAVRKLKVINGLPNGTFAPDQSISFGEAVTILMRMLGYTDADAGALWPQGYLDLAAAVRLTDGLSAGGSDTITRAQAAKLFVNALSAVKKDGSTFADAIGTVRSTMLVAADGSDAGFAALAGREDYRILRNGAEVTSSALHAGDVAWYDEDANTVRVSSSRVTAYYVSAYPSADRPEKIRLGQLSGGDDGYVEVLPGARSALAACKTGSLVTLLLTDDGKVAGVAQSGAEGNLIGYADGDGRVTLLGGLSTTARVSDSSLCGRLVRVLPGSGSGIRFEAFTLGDGGEGYDPASGARLVSLTIRSCTASALTAGDGTVYPVSSGVTLRDGAEEKSYADSFYFLRGEMSAALLLNADDEVTALYVDSSVSGGAVIVARDGSDAGFAAVAGRSDYSIYKGGERITAAQLKADDVAVYSASGNAFRVSSLRVKAYYADAKPGLTSPERIALQGLESTYEDGLFPVLDSARDAVAACKVGKAYVFLLTEDYRIAGVRQSGASTLIGYADESGAVELFCGLTAGDVSVAGRLAGSLVTVTAGSGSGLEAKSLTADTLRGDLDTVNACVGNRALSSDVRIYEKIGKSALTALTLDELPDTVANGKIAFAHVNDLGLVDVLVLENVIGKGMIYGRVTARSVLTDQDAYNTVVSIETPNGDSVGELLCAGFAAGETVWGGIVPGAGEESVGMASYRKATAYVVLSAVENVATDSFRSDRLVYADGYAYEVSSAVVCYNAVTGTWFSSLSAALSYAGRCTLYIDANNVVRALEIHQ